MHSKHPANASLLLLIANRLNKWTRHYPVYISFTSHGKCAYIHFMSDVKKITCVFTARMTWSKDIMCGLTFLLEMSHPVCHLCVVPWPCAGINGTETSCSPCLISWCQFVPWPGIHPPFAPVCFIEYFPLRSVKPSLFPNSPCWPSARTNKRELWRRIAPHWFWHCLPLCKLKEWLWSSWSYHSWLALSLHWITLPSKVAEMALLFVES